MFLKNKLLIVAMILIVAFGASSCFEINPDPGYIIPDSTYSFFPHLKGNTNRVSLRYTVSNAERFSVPYMPTGLDITYIVHVYKYRKQSEFEQTINHFSENAIYNSENTDSVFIIGSERDMLLRYSERYLEKIYRDEKIKYLILDFHETLFDKSMFYDSTTLVGLPSNFDFLVLKKGNDYVLDSAYKINWDVLPEKFEHGFSSGIAYDESENYIIYWVVAW